MNSDKEWTFLGLVPAFSSSSLQMQTFDYGGEADGTLLNKSLAHIRMQEGSHRKFAPSEISEFLKTAKAHPEQKRIRSAHCKAPQERWD